MTFAELASLIDGAGRPMPTVVDLQSLETALGLRLPDAYRAFLLTTPGGVVRGDMRFSSVGGDADIVKLKRIAGLTAWDDDALVEHFRIATDLQTPEDALAIATDPSGNDLVMVLRADRMGEILLLDHEMAEYGDRMDIEAAEASGYACRLAGSFSELIAGLALSQVT